MDENRTLFIQHDQMTRMQYKPITQQCPQHIRSHLCILLVSSSMERPPAYNVPDFEIVYEWLAGRIRPTTTHHKYDSWLATRAFSGIPQAACTFVNNSIQERRRRGERYVLMVDAATIQTHQVPKCEIVDVCVCVRVGGTLRECATFLLCTHSHTFAQANKQANNNARCATFAGQIRRSERNSS